MCCAIAALLLVALAGWRSLVRGARALRASPQWIAAAAAVALVALGGSAAADMRLHGAMLTNDGVLQMLRQDICGRPPA